MGVGADGAVEVIFGEGVERLAVGGEAPEAAAGWFGAGEFGYAGWSESRKVTATGRRANFTAAPIFCSSSFQFVAVVIVSPLKLNERGA